MDTFPSYEDYQTLKSKISNAKPGETLDPKQTNHHLLSEQEKLRNYWYNVAWTNALFGSYHYQKDGKWYSKNRDDEDKFYDPIAIAAAEAMFRKAKRKRTPDLPEPKVHSDEEIAHVTACAKLVRLYLEHGERRRLAARDGRPVPKPLRLVKTENMTAAEIEDAITRLGKLMGEP